MLAHLKTQLRQTSCSSSRPSSHQCSTNPHKKAFSKVLSGRSENTHKTPTAMQTSTKEPLRILATTTTSLQKKQKQQTTKFLFKEWWVGSDMEKANKSQICLISKKLPNLNCAISSWFWHLCGKSNIQRTAWNLCLGKFVRKYEICGREKSSWGAIKSHLEGQ